VFICAFLISSAEAQQYYGGVTGTVTDPTGAVVPNASVSLVNLNKGSVAKVVSNDAGIYRALNLTPDPYRVEAEAAGFKRFSQSPVTVENNRVLTVDIALEVGAATETVSVSATAPVLETESGKSTSTLEGRMVVKLPTYVSARADIRTYVYQLPNSNYGPSGRMMINGARTGQVRWDADGTVNKSPTGGNMMQEHSLNIESIQEFKYTLMNAGAESPAPAQVTLLSKSGTNAFHGAAYWDTHHSVFDARAHTLPATAKKPFARDNWLGANVSGPVFVPKLYDGRNRTFFMYTHEWWSKPLRGDAFITSPTAAMRSGDFSGLRNAAGDLIPVRDPLTGEAFPGNIIPGGRLHQGAKAYLDAIYPLPNVPTGVFANNAFVTSYVYNLVSHRMDMRFDQQVSAKNSAFFRWSRYWNPDSMYYRFLGSGENKTLWVIGSFQVTDTHSISPAWLNEFRLGSTYNQNTQRVGLQAGPILDTLGVQGVPEILYAGGITGVPAISITGMSGISQFSHGTSNTRLWDIYDTVSVMKGRHSIKFGVNLRKDISDSEFWDKPGTFSFTGNFTGSGVADFMLGLPFNAVRAYPRAALGPTRTHGWYSGWFVQDDFKVTPRLTLNLGLRWDTTFPGEETQGLYYNFDPTTGNLVVPSSEAIDRVIPAFPQNVSLVTASQAGFPSRLRNTDWNNFAPRVGVAWRPWGERFVIRTAYGIYYDPLSLGYIQTGGPWGGSETFVNQVANGRPLWQFPSAFPSGAPGQIAGTTSVGGVDVDIRNPYVQQWNLTLERQVEQIALRLQYVGTKSTQLYWVRDLNVPWPSTTPFDVSRRPWQQYRSVSVRTNGGNSVYHALTAGGERRFANGVTFNSFFTWASMFTDIYDGGETGGLISGQWFQTFDRKKWWGREMNVPKLRWTTTYFAELPFGRGKMFGAGWGHALNAIAGGWALSGLLNVETGWWVSPFYSGGTDPAGIQWNAGVPDRIAHGVRSNQGLHPNDFFLDPQAFVMPPNNVGRFGTSGLNFMQEPSWWEFGMGVQKSFPMGERVRLEWLTKFENLFNHGYWGHGSFSSGLDLSNPATFGRVTGGHAGFRKIGFLFRLTW
jgi:hypothetical protein